MPEAIASFTDPDGDVLAIHSLGMPLAVALIVNPHREDVGVAIRSEDVEKVVAAIRAAAGIESPEETA